MLKLLFLFLVVLGTAEARECASRNHVFLIHGIGGSARTFGVMDTYLNKANPCNVAVKFEYDTGNSKLSTKDFAKDFNAFIDYTLAKNGFNGSDKISLVMHSQGGLIGSFWLLNIRDARPDLYSRIDSFITLSTPYFGSRIARLGKRILFSLAARENNPFSPVGKLELRDMSYGSSAILLLKDEFSQIFKGTHIRFLAVSGEKVVSNAQVGEGDTTVSPYSANPNHYAYQISRHNGINEHHHLGVVPFTSVVATHIRSSIPGIAQVDKKCLRTSPCKHPAIGLIESHLDGKKTELKKRNFHKFRVHVYLRLPEFGTTSWRNLNVEAEDDHGGRWIAKLDHRRNDRLVSQSFVGIAEDSQEQNITLTLRRGKEVLRVDRIRVRGGLSTFVTFSPDVLTSDL